MGGDQRGASLSGSREHNPKCRLFMSPGEDRCGLLLGLRIGPLFVEAGFIVCPSPEMNFWRRLP